MRAPKALARNALLLSLAEQTIPFFYLRLRSGGPRSLLLGLLSSGSEKCPI